MYFSTSVYHPFSTLLSQHTRFFFKICNLFRLPKCRSLSVNFLLVTSIYPIFAFACLYSIWSLHRLSPFPLWPCHSLRSNCVWCIHFCPESVFISYLFRKSLNCLLRASTSLAHSFPWLQLVFRVLSYKPDFNSFSTICTFKLNMSPFGFSTFNLFQTITNNSTK